MAINPIIAMTLGYFGVIVLAFVVINFLTAGFLRVFMGVKGSRGKKIMTNITAVNRNYAKPGIVDNGFYIYKDGNGHEKRMKIPANMNIFYRFLNITWVNVDEEKNVFIAPDGREVNGPSVLDTKQQIQFILIIITAILCLIILIVLAGVVLKKINILIVSYDALATHFLTLNSTII
jgi:hypothetical protein